VGAATSTSAVATPPAAPAPRPMALHPGAPPSAEPAPGAGTVQELPGGDLKFDWGDDGPPAPVPAAASAERRKLAPEELFEKRRVAVFTREDLARAGPSVGELAAAELPAAYFDLTPEDFQRAVAERKRAAAAQPRTLQTRAMREAEAMRAARAAGAVHVRFLFPDSEGTVVQCELGGATRGKAVVALARMLAREDLRDGLYLFTTPPKAEVGEAEREKTLHELGWVPNANVHVGFRGGSWAGGGVLCGAAARRRGAVPETAGGSGGSAAGPSGTGAGEEPGAAGAAAAAGPVGVGGAPAAFSASTLERNEQVHKPKVPKWFKGAK